MTNLFSIAKRLKNWGLNVDNMVNSKLVETKTNSKYLIGYLGKVLRPINLIVPKNEWTC